MRFMVIVKSDPQTEEGQVPAAEDLEAMGRYNEELVKAGVLLAGEGLLPSSKGAKVRFSGGTPTVIDGPFAEAKELVAGFWLVEMKSKEEVIEWAKRIPCTTDVPSVVEIRQVFEPEEFVVAVPPPRN